MAVEVSEEWLLVLVCDDVVACNEAELQATIRPLRKATPVAQVEGVAARTSARRELVI